MNSSNSSTLSPINQSWILINFKKKNHMFQKKKKKKKKYFLKKKKKKKKKTLMNRIQINNDSHFFKTLSTLNLLKIFRVYLMQEVSKPSESKNQ